MFKNILLVISKKNTPTHLQTIEKIKEILPQHQQIPITQLNKEHLQNKDLIITVGGDGTLIKTSHFLDKTPILGINSEPQKSEGALTVLHNKQLEKIKEILKGNYKIIQRTRIKTLLNNRQLENAINEVYIGSFSQFHASRYTIKFNDKQEEQKSSGILIATPTGSNAWYKSAGGIPFSDKKLKFLVREPYKGKLFQPKILEGEIKNNQLTIISEMHHRAVIAIDSATVHNLKYGDKIQISISKSPLNIIGYM